MADQDSFERRLEWALRLYAGDAPVAIDALRLAQEIAAGHPRRSSRATSMWPENGRPTLVWLLVGALLVLVVISSVAVAGAIRPRDDRLVVGPTESSDNISDIPAEGGPFLAGNTYDSRVFGERFTFVMPPVDGSGSNAGLPSQFAYATPDVSAGLLLLSGPWWSMRFVDDLPITVDLCDETSEVLPDIPATPEAVGEWLEADRQWRVRSWRVGEAEPIPVDGRTAIRWDLLESEEDLGCHIRLPVGGHVWGEMLLRVYAIPTGDDTILLIGGSDMVNFEAVSAVMDGIVRSMDFD